MMSYEEEGEVIDWMKSLLERTSVVEAERVIEEDPKLKQRYEECVEELKLKLKDDINAGICVFP